MRPISCPGNLRGAAAFGTWLTDVRDEAVDLLRTAVTTDAVFAAVTATLARAFPAADAVSVTRWRGDHFQSLAARGRLAATAESADRLQHRHSGPCVTAATQRTTVVVDDLVVDRRWPEFARATALPLGVGAMLCVPLTAEHDELSSALNLYARHPRAFDAGQCSAATAAGTMLSDATRVALDRQRIATLETAVRTNRTVGTAAGIVAHEQAVSASEALTRLVTFSQRSRRPLVAVAQDVISRRSLLDVQAAALRDTPDR